MTKATTIQQLLDKTVQEYYKEQFEMYVKWCENLAIRNCTRDYQKLLANTAISKFFMERFNDLEHQALEILKPQECKITIDVARRIYSGVMIDIFASFPSALIKDARKLVIINDPRQN